MKQIAKATDCIKYASVLLRQTVRDTELKPVTLTINKLALHGDKTFLKIIKKTTCAENNKKKTSYFILLESDGGKFAIK